MQYFKISELVRSAVATCYNLDNRPSLAVIINLEKLTEKILDPIRRAYGKPIYINSGYRSPLLNAKVGGAKNSRHKLGLAADITGGSPAANRELLKACRKMLNQLPIGQLIAEKMTDNETPTWIHIDYSPTAERQYITT